MAAWKDLADFEARYGAGYDAAGRTVYANEFAMGASPSAKLATQAVHRQLINRANEEDGGGMIRALLQERNRNAARMSGVNPAPWLDLDAGTVSYSIDNSWRPQR